MKKFIFIVVAITGIFIFGYGSGVVAMRYRSFPIPELFSLRRNLINKKMELQDTKDVVKSDSMVSIPVTFYPTTEVEVDDEGIERIIKKDGNATLNVSSSDIALVLIDTWDYEDPKEGEEPNEFLGNIKILLEMCRQNGVTIIHAPSPPIIYKYAHYDRLEKEMEPVLKEYSSNESESQPPYLDWPPKYNDVFNQVDTIRSEAHAAEYKALPQVERDISRLLRPLDNEYVIGTYPQYRYVLHKNKIKLIFYVGGALNECMLNREAGLNRLVGLDDERTNFKIVVFEDCTSAMASSSIDALTFKHAMLEYYKFKIAFVANSKNLEFQRNYKGDLAKHSR